PPRDMGHGPQDIRYEIILREKHIFNSACLWRWNPRGSQPPHVHSAGCKLAHLTEAKRTGKKSRTP
ncbi:mCG57148, isoform CRA_a, partial [Mus musculus]